MSRRRQRPRHDLRFGFGGKIRAVGPVLTVVFLSVFLWVGIRDVTRVLWFYTWKQTPCQIERFEIRDDPKTQEAFRPDLLFHYQWEGRQYSGTQLWRGRESTDVAERIVMAKSDFLANGALLFCRVNPANPAEAALLPDRLDDQALFFVVFTISIGTTLIGAARVGWRGEVAQDHPKLTIPLFLVFAFIGVWMLAKGLVPQTVRYFSAPQWKETTAVVKRSRVGVHRHVKGGPSYYPDIYYRYQAGGGAEFQSNNVSIFSMGLGGYEGSHDFAKAHPAGSTMTCWFNPDKPWQVTLDRDLHLAWVGILFVTPFLAIGIGGLLWVTRRLKTRG